MKTKMYVLRTMEDFLKAFTGKAPYENHRLFDGAATSQFTVINDKNTALNLAKRAARDTQGNHIALVQIEIEGDFLLTMAHTGHQVEYNAERHWEWTFGANVAAHLNENSQAWMTVVGSDD